jgi:hypothetical protein
MLMPAVRAAGCVSAFSRVSFSPAVVQEKLLQRSFIDATDVEEVLLHVMPVPPAITAVMFPSHALRSSTKTASQLWAGGAAQRAPATLFLSSHAPLPFFSRIPLEFSFDATNDGGFRRRNL